VRPKTEAVRQYALILLLSLSLASASPAEAQLRGHGGPVRAVAVSPDGARIVSGSFDTTAILWSLATSTATQVLRFHEGAVNAVVFLRDGQIATAGEDASIAIWQPGQAKPISVLRGHTAPVAALAVSPDGNTLASASWDHTARLWSLTDGTSRTLEGHTQQVNGVAFTSDGRTVVTSGYDLTLRLWPIGDGTPTITTLPSPLNAVAVAQDGTVVTAGATGKIYFLSGAGTVERELQVGPAPVLALALSPDGALIAASSVNGGIAVIDARERRQLQTLVGPGLPAWSIAFLPDSSTLLTGGSDNLIRRWNARTGEALGDLTMSTAGDPLAAYQGDRGALVFRACVACHTLKEGQGLRAGPTLSGVFGRRIATERSYDFSPALRKLEIVWTADTLSKLFEIGPAAYTPGTKMPEQRLGAEDRAALVRFLEQATRP
jgi:cytochrome c